MLSTTPSTDIQVLHQLLLDETQQKDCALAKIKMLEAEIHSLKSVLTSQTLTTSTEALTTTAPFKFHGELILVVDDQPMNLDLVEALLGDMDLKIVCKTSAQDALSFMQTAQPHIILMDIQMPEMDGYSATEKIRSEFTHYTPIILAMTANDTAEDRQKSLDAGMQGHICKPIDADYLLAQLSYWLYRDNSPATNNSALLSTAISASPETALSTELPGIDLPAALARLRGNRSLLEDVLISFAEKAALIIPELQKAKHSNALDEAVRILHRLKGTSANLSAFKIAPLAARLETQAKNGQLPSDEELQELNAAINELINTAQMVQQPKIQTVQNTAAVDLLQLEPLLKRISTHLHSDLGQAEEAVDALNTLCAHSPWADSANKLRTVFYQFNLRAVNELISQGFK